MSFDEYKIEYLKLCFDEAKAIELINKVYKEQGYANPKIYFANDPYQQQLVANYVIDNESKYISKMFKAFNKDLLPRTNDDFFVFDNIRRRICSLTVNQAVDLHLTRPPREMHLEATKIANVSYMKKDLNTYPQHNKLMENFDYGINAKTGKFKVDELTNIFNIVASHEICVVCKPPTFLKLNDDNRLDCRTDYAVYFETGYGLNFVNSVHFDNDLFKRCFIDKIISAKEILLHENLEQKSVMIKEVGYETILNNTEHRILHQVNENSKVDGKPVMYQVIEFVFTTMNRHMAHRIVRVEDHTLHKVTCIGVPRIEQTLNCKGAIAWTFGLDTDKYNPIQEA